MQNDGTFDGGICLEFGKRCGELPVSLSDLGSGGSSEMEVRGTRISGIKEEDRHSCRVVA